jgi:uncharacterized membrane protein
MRVQIIPDFRSNVSDFVFKCGRIMHKALALKSRLGWSVAEIRYVDTKTSFTRGNLSAMPHFWYVISLLIVFASFVVALARYPVLPDPIPIPAIWDFNVGPNEWLPKSLGAVLLMPFISMGLVAAMWFSGTRIERAKLQIDHKEPMKSFAQHKKYRRLMGHGMGILAFALAALLFILGLQIAYDGFDVPIWLIVAIPIAACVPISVIPVRAGQGGARLKVDVTEITAANGGTAGSNTRSDDKYWAWGMFYHNPNDPACFVESRFGGNIGFNYSRLPVKIGVAIGVAALTACYVWMLVLVRAFV